METKEKTDQLVAMRLAMYERRIEKHYQAFREAGAAIRAIRDEKLWPQSVVPGLRGRSL